MPIFKKVALVVFLLVTILLGSFFGYAATLPSAWHVERSVTIAAPRETVWPLVSDLRAWERWIPWTKEVDPTLDRQVLGEPGASQKMSWAGNVMGIGSITTTELDAPREIRYDLRFAGVDSPSRGSVRLAETGDGSTVVTWTDDGDMGGSLIGRYFITKLELMVATDFDQGLAKLKSIVERGESPAE